MLYFFTTQNCSFYKIRFQISPSENTTFYAFSPLILLLLPHLVFDLVMTSIPWCYYHLSTPSCFNFLPIQLTPCLALPITSCSYSQFSCSTCLHSRICFTTWWNSTWDEYSYLFSLTPGMLHSIRQTEKIINTIATKFITPKLNWAFKIKKSFYIFLISFLFYSP